jgi:hypothetical protein
MLHIRKTLTKKEREEYKQWQKKHKATKLTKTQEQTISNNFWANYSQSMNRGNIRQSSDFLDRLQSLKPETSKRVTYQDEEMIRREREAQKEIEAKKLRLAPHYNKGPVQYITEGIDLYTLGKKV